MAERERGDRNIGDDDPQQYAEGAHRRPPMYSGGANGSSPTSSAGRPADPRIAASSAPPARSGHNQPTAASLSGITIEQQELKALAAPAARCPLGNLVSPSASCRARCQETPRIPCTGYCSTSGAPICRSKMYRLDLQLISLAWHPHAGSGRWLTRHQLRLRLFSKADTSRLVSRKGRPACFARVRVLRLVEPTAFRADAVRPAGQVADFLMLGGWR